jgi:hypothetical protein
VRRHLPDMQKGTLERRLNDENLPDAARELIAIRLEASSTSVAKYQALVNATSATGGCAARLEFCGAARTGRWSGRLFQPQNLPTPEAQRRGDRRHHRRAQGRLRRPRVRRRDRALLVGHSRRDRRAIKARSWSSPTSPTSRGACWRGSPASSGSSTPSAAYDEGRRPRPLSRHRRADPRQARPTR